MAELDVTGAAPVLERPRRRRRWYWCGTVLLAAAVAIGVVGIGPSHAPRPAPPPTTGPLAWVEKLVDAPPRGGLAGDATFTKALLDRVTGLVRDNTDVTALIALDGRPHPEQEVRLLFAADIEDLRVAVLALRLPAMVDEINGRTKIVSLTGLRGATVDQLVAPVTGASTSLSVDTTTSPAQPFTVIRAGRENPVWLGLAPPQCSISTATDPAATDFRDEPTGSYIVRTPANARPEYWRLTCDGTVREERRAPSLSGGAADAELVNWDGPTGR